MLFSRLSELPNPLCSVSVCHNRWCHLPPTGSHRFISSPHPQPTSPQRAPALSSYWHCNQWSWVQDLIYLRTMGVPNPIPTSCLESLLAGAVHHPLLSWHLKEVPCIPQELYNPIAQQTSTRSHVAHGHPFPGGEGNKIIFMGGWQYPGSSSNLFCFIFSICLSLHLWFPEDMDVGTAVSCTQHAGAQAT